MSKLQAETGTYPYIICKLKKKRLPFQSIWFVFITIQSKQKLAQETELK